MAEYHKYLNLLNLILKVSNNEFPTHIYFQLLLHDYEYMALILSFLYIVIAHFHVACSTMKITILYWRCNVRMTKWK